MGKFEARFERAKESNAFRRLTFEKKTRDFEYEPSEEEDKENAALQRSGEQEILTLHNPAAMLFHSGREDRRYDPVSGEVLPKYRVSHMEYTVEEKLGLARQEEHQTQPLRTFEFFTVAPTREGASGAAQKTVREAVEPRT